MLDEAMLLTSELCTNALQHTVSGSGGTFTVTVIREMGRARIEVRDNGAAQAPATQPRDESSERGRGLGLVEVLANRWGYRGSQHGRTVFFEVTWPALG
jgi:anti-sigma regulatory factor (Ser/Thr protein kinase)